MAAKPPNRDFYAAGMAAAEEGRHSDAIAAYERALESAPDDARVLFALGNTALALGHSQAAESFFRRVLAQAPDRTEALVNLANVLRKGGRTTEIIELLRPAIERNPSASELWLTLGSSLREAKDTKTAEIFTREALRLSPKSAAALGNLADLIADEGALDEALTLYEKAIAQEPENAQARLNRAILFFLKGELKQGWADYEYRLRIKSRAITANHGLPHWDGSVRHGLRLLVTAEQGIGDQLMFASLIPELAAGLARGRGRVILETEPRLVPLLTRSFPSVLVRPSRIETRGGGFFAHYDWLERGEADAAIPIGSLPRIMRNAISDFPRTNAYLLGDESERGRWAGWLRTQGQGPFIGVCWRSGSMGGLRNIQYAPLEDWAAFIRDLRATVVSVQYDADAKEIESLQRLSGRRIVVPPNLDQKHEIDRTAAFMSILDAVVTAPTSVAWIAAGLGMPTCKILYNNSWTSFGRDYEPFAPSAHCIMPETVGNWPDAFAKAAAVLTPIMR
jgi:tetratricopeptide (TPR) repeat protein